MSNENIKITQDVFNQSVLDQMQQMNDVLIRFEDRLDILDRRDRRRHAHEIDSLLSDNSGTYPSNGRPNAMSNGYHRNGQPNQAAAAPNRVVHREDCNLYHYLDIGALSPSGQARPTEHLKEEFESIKDGTQRIHLPAGLKLSDSRQGLKRECQQTFNVVQKCGQFTEVALKILSTLPKDDIAVRDLVVTCAAQIKYLSDEQCALLVQGNYSENTSRIFRTLQRNTAFADSENVSTLRTAAEFVRCRYCKIC